MHSFSQFTRSTRWEEFAWVGAIIFKGNFMVSGQFSGGGTVFLRSNCRGEGAIFLGGDCPRGIYPGGNHPGGNCPGSNFSLRQLSSGVIVRWAIIQGEIAWGQLTGGNFTQGQLSGHRLWYTLFDPSRKLKGANYSKTQYSISSKMH